MWVMKRNANFRYQIDRRLGSLVAVFALLLAVVAPTIASAAQLTERSIALSSAAASAAGVSYEVNFKAAGNAGAFIVDFCRDSPVIGETCTPPVGFSLSSATTATAGFTRTVLDANTIMLVGEIEASDEVVVQIDNVTNPSEVGPMYVRVVTYDLAANADDYTSTALGSGVVDRGGAAVSIIYAIGVSGSVLESMLFCVSGDEIDEDCTNTTAPVLELGETVGDVKALVPTSVSEGTIHTQISTNAVTGAVVSLKSSALGCGGLMRAGAPSACDITPATSGGVSEGDAKFGIKTAAATNTVGVAGATGVFQPVADSGYGTTAFFLGYVEGNGTGVTSVFGDPFLDTNGAPANNKNMALTFGASVSNNTPAGQYSADISLIATGKF